MASDAFRSLTSASCVWHITATVIIKKYELFDEFNVEFLWCVQSMNLSYSKTKRERIVPWFFMSYKKKRHKVWTSMEKSKQCERGSVAVKVCDWMPWLMCRMWKHQTFHSKWWIVLLFLKANNNVHRTLGRHSPIRIYSRGIILSFCVDFFFTKTKCFNG